MSKQKTIYAMSELESVYEAGSSPEFSRYAFHMSDPAFFICPGAHSPVTSLPDEESDVICSIPPGDFWTYLGLRNSGWKTTEKCEEVDMQGAFE